MAFSDFQAVWEKPAKTFLASSYCRGGFYSPIALTTMNKNTWKTLYMLGGNTISRFHLWKKVTLTPEGWPFTSLCEKNWSTAFQWRWHGHSSWETLRIHRHKFTWDRKIGTTMPYLMWNKFEACIVNNLGMENYKQKNYCAPIIPEMILDLWIGLCV